MILLDSKLEDTEILAYISERSSYWNVCRQLTQNAMVGAFAQAYRNIEEFSLVQNSKKELHNLLRQTIEQRHSFRELLNADITVPKIVSADVLARMDGKTFFPSLNWVEQLAWIQSTKLVDTIRERDGFKDIHPDVMRENKKAEARKRLLAQDLEKLREQLAVAKNAFHLAPEKFKAQKEYTVKELEKRIAEVEASGVPFGSSLLVEEK